MSDFASSVDNIQIQRGAGTSTNGAAAFGATVAMQTQKPDLKPYAEYSLSAGSFGTVKNSVKTGTGLLRDHFVFDARYSNVQSDGYIVIVEFFNAVFFIFSAGVVGPVVVQINGRDTVPGLIRFFYIAECLEADQSVVAVIGG